MARIPNSSRTSLANPSYLQLIAASTENGAPRGLLFPKEIKALLHFLRKEKKASQSSMNQAYSALKFFYETSRPWNGQQIPRCKRGRRLPVVPSLEEVQSILSATENLKRLTIFATICSGGLRLSEEAEPKVTAIEACRTARPGRPQGNFERCQSATSPIALS
jgi:integrase/recombinase XerD